MGKIRFVANETFDKMNCKNCVYGKKTDDYFYCPFADCFYKKNKKAKEIMIQNY